MQKYTDQQALSKLQSYCAYQERCVQEIRQKMRTWAIPKRSADAILQQLINDQFIDEERYVRSYISGKFRLKHWGRIKIRQSLSLKGINLELVDQLLETEITEEQYLDSLIDVLRRKTANLPDDLSPQERRHKLAAYALGAGYEPSLVWEQVAIMVK